MRTSRILAGIAIASLAACGGRVGSSRSGNPSSGPDPAAYAGGYTGSGAAIGWQPGSGAQGATGGSTSSGGSAAGGTSGFGGSGFGGSGFGGSGFGGSGFGGSGAGGSGAGCNGANCPSSGLGAPCCTWDGVCGIDLADGNGCISGNSCNPASCSTPSNGGTPCCAGGHCGGDVGAGCQVPSCSCSGQLGIQACCTTSNECGLQASSYGCVAVPECFTSLDSCHGCLCDNCSDQLAKVHVIGWTSYFNCALGAGCMMLESCSQCPAPPNPFGNNDYMLVDAALKCATTCPCP